MGNTQKGERVFGVRKRRWLPKGKTCTDQRVQLLLGFTRVLGFSLSIFSGC